MPPTTDIINVFITGFGPFPKFDGRGGLYDRNASHLLTKLLPSSLPPSHPLNPTSHHINLINPTAAEDKYVKTEYAYIRQYVSDLHDSHKEDVDLFLHIGMAAGWDYVSIERKAYKQGFGWGWGSTGEKKVHYMLEDAEGKNVTEAPVMPWADSVPIGLTGTLDVDAMVEGANKALGGKERKEELHDVTDVMGAQWVDKKGGLTVKPHDDPGTYCCGFIYYESLANKFYKGTKGHVMFCHVPGETDKANLERARESILAVIGAAVSAILKVRGKEA